MNEEEPGGLIMLKPSDQTDTQAIVSELENGRGSRRDLVALLIYIRGHISPDMVQDLAHCVAHDERDRGLAHTYIEHFVEHLIDVFENGGILDVGLLFPIDDVIAELASDLVNLGIEIDETRLKSHAAELKRLIADMLDSVKVKLANPQVANCQFSSHETNEGVQLTFTVYFNEELRGVIRVPTNVGVAFPVLSG
jgi:hypothetical protein